MKQLIGQCILDTLDYGVSKLPNPSGLPQVSGITYNVNTSFKRTVLTDANGCYWKKKNFKCKDKWRRIK